MTVQAKADVLRISASCAFPEVPDFELPQGFSSLTQSRLDKSRFSFPTRRIEAFDGTTRQIEFGRLLTSLRRVVAAAGITPDFVSSHDASVRLYISLSPSDGDAAVSLLPALYQEWLDIGTTFRFDVIK